MKSRNNLYSVKYILSRFKTVKFNFVFKYTKLVKTKLKLTKTN